MGRLGRVVPHAKAADECVGIVAGPTSSWQLVHVDDVATTYYDIFGLKCRDQTFDHVFHEIAPAFLAEALEAQVAHVIFVGAFLIRQVTEFHRFDNAVYDHRRTESCSQSQEQHLAAPVTAERLHRRIIDNPNRQAERQRKIESQPARSQVVRFGDGTIVEYRPGKANGYDVVGPPPRKLLHAGDHLSRRHSGSGDDFPFLLLSRGKYFDMTPTDVDGQDFHLRRSFVRPRSANTTFLR